MPTHGSLTYKLPNGIYKNIFVLRCGYLYDLGHKLFNIYNTSEKVEKLFLFDSIRAVESAIEKTKIGYCGHRSQIAEKYKDLELEGDYNYFFKDGKWYFDVSWKHEENDIAFLEANNAITIKEGCFILLTQDMIKNDLEYYPPEPEPEPEGTKTEEEIIKLFEQHHKEEFGKFDRILYKHHHNRLIYALIKIEELYGKLDLQTDDYDNLIYMKLPTKSISTYDVKDLLRCGVELGQFRGANYRYLLIDLDKGLKYEY